MACGTGGISALRMPLSRGHAGRDQAALPFMSQDEGCLCCTQQAGLRGTMVLTWAALHAQRRVQRAGSAAGTCHFPTRSPLLVREIGMEELRLVERLQ